MITFTSDKCFRLVDRDQRELQGNMTTGREGGKVWQYHHPHCPESWAYYTNLRVVSQDVYMDVCCEGLVLCSVRSKWQRTLRSGCDCQCSSSHNTTLWWIVPCLHHTVIAQVEGMVSSLDLMSTLSLLFDGQHDIRHPQQLCTTPGKDETWN
jgi:hypothetical protein